MTLPARQSPLTLFLVAGEESGDILGAALMQALTARTGGNVRFLGVGGQRMTAAGLVSIFPMGELSLHGFTAVIGRLPRLLARLRQATEAVLAAKPDALVLVDAPAFNLRLGRRVRRRNSAVPIIQYVSPQVWAHNSWRARRMAQVVDEVMAILPFEPAVHRRLGGPPCTYVGHPLLERLHVLHPAAGERSPLLAGHRRTLLVLPGSRRSEVTKLMAPFGDAVAMIAAKTPDLNVVLPAVPHLRDEIEARLATWPVKPVLVFGEEPKLAAFRRAHAALAASGTVTLELALAGVPMAVAYRVDPIVRPFKRFLASHSIVLANLVLGENVIPEFIDRDMSPERLSAAVMPLLADTPQRARQLAAFERIDGIMIPQGEKPAELAADAVLATIARRRAPVALPSAA